MEKKSKNQGKPEQSAAKMKGRKNGIWKKKSFWIILVLIFLVIIFIIWSVMMKRSRNQKNLEARVNSTIVELGNVENVIESSGSLMAAETEDVLIPNGLEVDEIKVETGDQVSKGQIIAKLNKTSVTSALVDIQESLDNIEDSLDDDDDLTSLEIEELEEEQTELEKIEASLKNLRENPVIKATTDGIIGSINLSERTGGTGNSSNETTTQSNGNITATTTAVSAPKVQATLLSTGQTGITPAKITAFTTGKVIPLSATGEDSSETNEPATTETEEPTTATTEQPEETTTTEKKTETTQSGNTSDKTETSEKKIQNISDYTSLVVQTPAAGETPQSSIAETKYYSGRISWSPNVSKFESGKTYTATITLTAKSGYTFTKNALPNIKNVTVKCIVTGTGEGNQLKITAKFTVAKAKAEANSEAPGTQTGKQPSSFSGSGGNMTSQAAAVSAASGSTSSSDSNYNAYETVAFTIQKEEKVLVEVNVDELDILSVSKGQTATVVLDAVEDEEFEGTVTKVANISSSESGNAKYPVEIELAMDENMRIGMTATVTIQVEQAVNVPVISMAALQEKGEETFVYTSQESDGTLSGETTVETGLSDGEKIEIVSGLKEGDTVYYTRNAGDTDAEFNMGNGMQMMPGRNGTGDSSGKQNKWNGGERPEGAAALLLRPIRGGA